VWGGAEEERGMSTYTATYMGCGPIYTLVRVCPGIRGKLGVAVATQGGAHVSSLGLGNALNTHM
jgi:hypothetical protein